MKNKIIKNGFTLLEIIAVISITAIITAIVTASFILTSRTLMIANQFILEENEKMRIYSVLEKQLLCVYYSDSLKFSLYGSETVTSDYSNNSNIEFLTS
jgi:prepilin-type N-terminal cleavage/methylation domain-containing protein